MEGHSNPRNKQSRNWEQQSTLRTINKLVLRNPPVPPGAVPEHTRGEGEDTRRRKKRRERRRGRTKDRKETKEGGKKSI